MRKRGWMAAVVVLAVLMGGCMAGNPLVNSDREQTAQEQVKADRDTNIAKTQPPSITQTGGGKDGTGAGGPQTMIMGDEALKQLAAMIQYGQATQEERARAWNWSQTVKLSLIGFAIGLGLLALVIWFIWRKTAAIRAKMTAAVAPITEKIKAYVSAKSETTDAATMAALDAKISALNSQKADIEKAMSKA